ncbi:hypothetical protein [Xanthomonas hortorum]|uniref:Metallohydrolase n=1 Tax=Xanthomonas hortorum pv. hederae TaxID=453603 RepID=A0A9X4BVL3_9XANT|nr:hypothetical protein [Xanthomonas hortorum]MDC8640397.1 hypothetical protein [Xanthomonas hortorum pv. hederae]
MATKHQVIFYPVGNGDTTQIILDNGKRVLFDFRHKECAEDDSTPEIDLKATLKKDLEEADRDSFDVVAFTHADNDHIQGSTDFFWLEHAKRYHGEGRIKIDELWVPAAMLLEEATQDQQSEEFVLLRQEARHRLLEGKGILVFSKPQALADWLEPKLKDRGEALSARDHLFVDAGTLVPGFTLAQDNVEFFCHSPFIEHCDDGDIIRNSAALVFNVRLQADGLTFDYLEVGDAEYCDLEKIVDITKYHKNDNRLAWDLFNIPHHCSYRALSDEKGDDETTPCEKVAELLMMGKPDSYVVSCSLPVPDTKEAYEQVQPPHIQARKTYEKYLKKVNGRSFLVTMEEPNGYKPQPIVFNVAAAGVTWEKSAASLGSVAIVASRPSRAGA